MLTLVTVVPCLGGIWGLKLHVCYHNNEHDTQHTSKFAQFHEHIIVMHYAAYIRARLVKQLCHSNRTILWRVSIIRFRAIIIEMISSHRSIAAFNEHTLSPRLPSSHNFGWKITQFTPFIADLWPTIQLKLYKFDLFWAQHFTGSWLCQNSLFLGPLKWCMKLYMY